MDAKHALFGVILIVVLAIGAYIVFVPAVPTIPDEDLELEEIEDYNLFEGMEIPPLKSYSTLSECKNLAYSDEDDCRRQVAAKTNDPEICDALNQDDIDWCKAHVLVATNNFSACQTLSSNAANQCWFEAAKKTQKKDYCGSIGLLFLKDDCYHALSMQGSDPSVCTPISNIDQREDCLLRTIFNSAQPAPSQCGLLTDLEIIDDCYYGVALILNQPPVCGQIADPVLKTNCISDLNAEFA